MSKRKKLFKTVLTTVLILTLAITYVTAIQPVIALRTANIHIYATPDPVGIGQTIRFGGWITPLPSYSLPNFVYWTNITFEITNPGGTVEKFDPISADSAAAFVIAYVPDQLGEYTVKCSWNGDSSSPAQAYTYDPVSATTTFTVQEEPILPKSGQPLPGPNDYWERPISAEYKEWSILAGSWYLSQGPSRGGYDSSVANYQPYSLAPNTPHINWAIKASPGGLIGGESGSSKFTEIVDMPILGGLGIYADSWITIPHTAGYGALIGSGETGVPQSTDMTTFTLHCIDVRTGEELWSQPTYTFGVTPHGGSGRTGPMLRGYIEDVPELMSSGGAGPKAYLFATGSTFVRWDAFTGTQMLVMNNTLTGTFDGRYMYSKSGSNLIKWDLTALGKGETVADVVVYNVTAPSVTHADKTSYLSPSIVEGDLGLATYTVSYDDGERTERGIAGISLETGQLLWNKTLYGYGTPQFTSCISNGKYFDMSYDTKWHCFDMKTGAELWTSEPSELPWGLFGGYASAGAYNLFYSFRYDGYLRAINCTTGETEWKYYSGNSGLETPYGTWPWFSPPAVADGKLYAATSEHSPSNPPWRESQLYCFNATTGDVIWSFPWLGGYKAVADGMLVAANEYDGRLYGFGKGPSATAVSASPKISELENKVLVEGLITDESPGTKSSALSARYPNGVPAVADADMSQWMQYLYLQNFTIRPTDIQGVEVAIKVLDPNNNYYEVGRTTSDADGFFKLTFEPQIPGDYTVIAEFEGSESYYSSRAKTAISVTEATQETEAIQPLSMSDQYLLPGIGAIIAAIIAVGAVLVFLMLRKR